MPSDDKKGGILDDIPHNRTDPRPDFSKDPLPKKKLPEYLQQTLDNDEKLLETLYDGAAPESTDSNLRYAAYATRVRTILLAGQRYIAYTSDIGESFRPVAHPYLVKGAYGVSWAYLAGDVAHEGYKAYLRNQRVLHPDTPAEKQEIVSSDKHAEPKDQVVSLGPGITGGSVGQASPAKVPAIEDYRAVMAQRAIFQGIASMGLPAFTIHSIVKYSGKALKDAKNTKIRSYGPIGLGLAAVPALPFMFDKPVEHAVEWIFHKTFEAVGGPDAVRGRPVTGDSELRQIENQRGARKEKEL
ncbi:mitochondrial 18 KDa protein-domain-containing protein [Delphinella strobiligena]|nr:mitochondrial 18 KDa protein-domain-containing protein [Delphinella strobiligena]